VEDFAGEFNPAGRWALPRALVGVVGVGWSTRSGTSIRA